jgi:hypothetical protein
MPNGAIREYDSVKAASGASGVSSSDIVGACRGKKHRPGRCRWEYIGTPETLREQLNAVGENNDSAVSGPNEPAATQTAQKEDIGTLTDAEIEDEIAEMFGWHTTDHDDSDDAKIEDAIAELLGWCSLDDINK